MLLVEFDMFYFLFCPQVPQWKEIKVLASPHKDTIQRIEQLKATNRYLSLSKEGCIVFWDNHVKIQRSIKITTDTMKPRYEVEFLFCFFEKEKIIYLKTRKKSCGIF